MRRAFVWMLLLSWISGAQEHRFVQVPNWTIPTGTPGLQDHLGRLWMATGNDVKCFDGTRFYSLRDFGPLHVNGRSSGGFAEDSDGGIWFTSDSALYRFAAGHIAVMRQGWAESVIKIAPGVMLANMGGPGEHDPPELHLYRFQKISGSWHYEQLGDWTSRFEGVLTRDHRGNVLFACSNGWCELSRHDILAWQPGYHQGGPVRHPDVYPGIELILRDRFDCLWFRGTDGAAYQLPRQAKPVRLPPEIASNGLTLSEMPKGEILIPSYLTIAIGRPGTFRVFNTNSAPINPGGTFVAEDGTIWAGGPKGLYHSSDPRRLELWTDREGLANPRAMARVGSQIFASSRLGIAVLSADRSHWIALPPSRELGLIRSLVRGPGDTLLAVPHHNGVAQLDLAGRIIARTPPDADNEAMQLSSDDQGRFWLAGHGVSRVVLEGRTIRLIPEPLPDPRTMGTDIKFEPQSRTLWACYAGGLAVKHEHGWSQITTAQGLLENLCRALLPKRENVWVGYFSANAFALVRPDFANGVTVRQFRPGGDVGFSNRVNAFQSDSRGWIWRGTGGGLYVASAAEAESGKWIMLNETDGLPDTGVEQQALFPDEDGSMWFASGNTIGHLRLPGDFVQPRFAPKVFVSGYSWQGTGPQIRDAANALPFAANITAYIGSLQFDRRNALRIRYRLMSGERAWHETSSLDVPIGRFYWGTHTLEVQGRLINGPWSASSRAGFDIIRPLWLSWPALLAYCAFGFSGIATARRRGQRSRSRERKSLPDLREWRLAALSPESHELIDRTLDGRYRIESVLDRGGFAAVLKGFDLRQQIPCAIKVFRHELRDKDWLSRRFRQEVSALERIRHPNIVQILGHGTTPEGGPYLVMEFIEGCTLRDRFNAGPLPCIEIADLLRQAGAALDEIHRHGIYHRDLKPENLMIRSNGSPVHKLVLIDFSIAIIQEPNETVHGLSRVAGTIDYMAPEQTIGYADSATDVYGLAKVLMEMLTGMPLSTLLPKASLDLPERVREALILHHPSLSPESIYFISSALEFDPKRRPRDAGVFANIISRDLAASSQ